MEATIGLNLPNENTNFLPVDWDWIIREYPVKESVAMEEWTALSPEIATNNVTWKLGKMWVENATGSDFFGILAEAIRSTDADYATAFKLKKVYVPVWGRATAEFTVWAWTFTTADVFKTVEIHSDSKSLAVDTLGKWARIVKYISWTRWICEFTMPTTEVA